MPGVDFAHIVKKLFYIFKKYFPENLNNFAIFYVTLLLKEHPTFSGIKLTVSFSEDVTLNHDEFRAAMFIISVSQEGTGKAKGCPSRIWITLACCISPSNPHKMRPG